MNEIEKRYKEIENILYSRHSQIKKNGIEHIKKILSKLGEPQKKMGKIIHITGTNGKGSVAYISESILRNIGFKTALYTSPHIDDLTERIQINRTPISKEDFIKLFDHVYSLSKDLSFFEMMTVIAFLYFENKVDYSVIEVGIGGLYDTTNVFDNTSLCFITSISLDHTELLGKTKSEIAFQKSGIIKKGSVCVTPRFEEGIKDIVYKKCVENNAYHLECDNFFEIKNFDRINGLMNILNKETGDEFNMSILGLKQPLNLSMVVKGLEKIGIRPDKKTLQKALSDIKINCRFQTLVKNINGKEKFLVLDGAHNPEAFSVLIDNLRFFDIKDPVLVFSILSTKNYAEVIKKICDCGLFKRVIICEINNTKKLSATFIADEFSKYSSDIELTVISDYDIALKYASNLSDNICVCGSFYLVSDVIKIIKENI